MGKPRFDPPTNTFPYKISRRLNAMSYPRPVFIDTGEDLPSFTPRGIRQSALRALPNDRLNDASWPYVRRFLMLKRQYKHIFSSDRLHRIDKMIEAANATPYTKLANCVLDLKKTDKDIKRRRAWTESEWKKHMEYISQIANPKKDYRPPPISRGKHKPLEDLLDRIEEICKPSHLKMYKRLSQEVWYRNPVKVQPNALKYVATDRVKKLATPKVLPQED